MLKMLYVVQLYNDVTNNTPDKTWTICVERGGTWHDGTISYGVMWYGKWFNKGNDIHFQSFINVNMNSAVAFNVSRINSKLLTGYYTAVMDKEIQNMTMTLTYKGSTCDNYNPLEEIPYALYSIFNI